MIPTERAPERIERPRIITVIALWQLFRAGLLLTVTCIVLTNPDAKWGPLGFWELVYITSNGGRPSLLVVPFIIYAFAVGIGLWFLKRWARVALMITSGITALMWLRYLALNWALATQLSLFRPLQPGLQQQSVYMLTATDALIFLLLAFHPGVVEASEPLIEGRASARATLRLLEGPDFSPAITAARSGATALPKSDSLSANSALDRLPP